MTDGAVALDEGIVERHHTDLIVTVPSGMSRTPTLALAQELAMQAGATEERAGVFRVPVGRAADLADVLGHPWPASRARWTWTATAAASLAAAQAVATAASRSASEGEVETVVAELDGRLRAAGFERNLLPAQRGAVAALLVAGGGGNFSVPGSGKTTMTYALYALLKAAGTVDRLLVIAPQSAYEAWREEAADCFAEAHRPPVEIAPRAARLNTEVLVLNYERASGAAVRATIDAWGYRHRILVVFDEAHRAKRGARGLHGLGALDLSSLAAARLVLTGTPMPNGPDDLASVLELAWPGHGEDLARRSRAGAGVGWVRITKQDLGLEEAEVVVEPVHLDEAHQRLYETFASGVLDSLNALPAEAGLARRALVRMIACATNPMLVAADQANDELLRWPGELAALEPLDALLSDLAGATRPAKLLAAARHAERHAASGRKLLVWTNFIGNVIELERLLAPFGTAVVTGATPRSEPAAPTDRERELRRFREDPACTVLIATPQTLGEGISLHKVCQSQLHVDRTFNAGLFLQALDRTHRIGMPPSTPARAVVLSAVGTIDERIDSALRSKLTAMQATLRDPSLARLASVAFGAEAAVPSDEEVRRLLGHLS